MIPVKVEQMFLSNMGFVVLLKGVEDARSLPIVIGATEAQSIALWLSQEPLPRPLTHDLMKTVLESLNCRLKRTEVCDLRDGTFFASLVLEKESRELPVDARPSDAIALALRFGAPIFVDNSVMDEAGRVLEAGELQSPPGGGKPEESPKAPSKPRGRRSKAARQEDFRRDLLKAIEEERYEDAASLRDKLRDLEDKNKGN